MVHPLPYDHAWNGGIGAGAPGHGLPGGFSEYYLLARHDEPDGADGEPTDEKRELREEYEPPHSPFGRIYALIASGAFTYDEVMRKIPWIVILTMINDPGQRRKKKEEEEIIQTEEEELDFLGLP